MCGVQTLLSKSMRSCSLGMNLQKCLSVIDWVAPTRWRRAPPFSLAFCYLKGRPVPSSFQCLNTTWPKHCRCWQLLATKSSQRPPRMSTNHFDSKRFDGEPHFSECAKIANVAPCTFETQQDMNSERQYGLHHLGLLQLRRLQAPPKAKLHQLGKHAGQQHT